MRIYKITIICMAILCIITSIITITTYHDKIGAKKLNSVSYKQKWVSEDRAYSIDIPSNWHIINIGTIIAQDFISGTLVSATIADEPLENRSAESEYLLDSAINNVNSTLESGGCTLLESHTGQIGTYPSAYVVTTLDDGSEKPVNFMSFSISTPKGIYSIQFMMIPRERFRELRSEMEEIADSFVLITEKSDTFSETESGNN